VTVTLETRQQLAAPRRLRSLPPAFVGVPSDRVVALHSPQHPDLPPSYVSNARALVERHPSSPTALARLAQAEQAVGNDDEAVAAARAALACAAEQTDTGAELAAVTVMAAAGHASEAELELARLQPTGPLAVFYANLAAERGAFAEALERVDSEDSAEAWSVRGWVSLKQRDFPAAIKGFRQALRRGGPTPAALTNLGLAHAALGEREHAISETRQALKLVPGQSKRVGFNLASYYLAGGDYEQALDVIRSLQQENPRDVEPLFGEARIHLAAGYAERAQRPLRRARTTLWAYLDDIERAELTANLVFVNWHLNQINARDAAVKVVRELEKIQHGSLRMAEMLPVLLPRFSDADLFRKQLARIRQAHPKAPLGSLELHRAKLERRFDDATALALRWAEESVLDPEPAIEATYLLCDVTGDFQRAVTIGRAAHRRMPANTVLSNNLAYALALVGDIAEARRHLPPHDTPHHIATRALVALRAGHLDEARAGYRTAFARAKKTSDAALPGLVLLHAHMGFEDFAPDTERLPEIEQGVELPDDWEDDARFAITSTMFERRGIRPPTWFPGGARLAI
jgi:tetratricopeptide (TPR) repeat protein